MKRDLTIGNGKGYAFYVGLAFLAVTSLAVIRSGYPFGGSRSAISSTQALPAQVLPKKSGVTKDSVAELLSSHLAENHYPNEMDIPEHGKGIIQYALDPILQEEMETLFHTYRPDYGAFVAMDASTGQIVALVSYTQKGAIRGNLALRASYPAASVFKVVTAAAALENEKVRPDSLIAYNGGNHTLYKSNILKVGYNRWTRQITLKDAFAKSVNTVFGRLGAFSVGSNSLREYADKFAFNRAIAADLPVQPGRAPIPEDLWGLAEAASGYTRENTMSPIQGAMMAAAVVNDGVMMEPYIVQSVFAQDGTQLYTAAPNVAHVALEQDTARELKSLMRQTVANGTSKKSFRGFARGKMTEIEVGGKTGSLTGMDPQGKYDWFVGFAEGGNRKLAIAALTIHEKIWRVKSSYLARRAIENYFR